MARRKVKKKISPNTSGWHPVYLKGSFMIIAILGLLISSYLVKDFNYRFSFILIFTLMFIASIISMTKAPLLGERGNN